MFQPACGNRGETRANIQPCILKRGNRKTLKKQIPGNRKREVILWTQAASGNRCEVWTHTCLGQKWSFVTCKSQIINTWERFSPICKRSWEPRRNSSKFGIEANKGQCTDVGIVHVIGNESNHSSWTELHWNLEVYKNTNFKDIQSLFRCHSEVDTGPF